MPRPPSATVVVADAEEAEVEVDDVRASNVPALITNAPATATKMVTVSANIAYVLSDEPCFDVSKPNLCVPIAPVLP
jgi:hypothetical protein